MAARQIIVAQVLALLRLDGIGVFQTGLDQAFARTAQTAATFERDAAALAQRHPQKVAVVRRRHDLAAIGDEGDQWNGRLKCRRAKAGRPAAPP